MGADWVVMVAGHRLEIGSCTAEEILRALRRLLLRRCRREGPMRLTGSAVPDIGSPF